MKKDLLINSSGFVLNLLEKILDANIQVKGIKNIPKNNPRIFVANHFTRMEAMLIPYALYNVTNKKVGVIADDSLFKTYFGSFLEELGAMKKSAPYRNNIMLSHLLTGEKDWMVFPEGMMVKAKDISKEGNHYCVKIDGACQRVHTGAAYFALNSQLLREHYFNKKIKNLTKFKRKYFLNENHEIDKNETMIVPINITYSNLRTGTNFLTDMTSKFLNDIGKHFLEELEIEGNIALNSKITIQILKPISTKEILKHIYKRELNHSRIINKYRYELTHEFMTSIYENLTVNFDHIFVLTLFMLHRKKVKKVYFKRLLYIAIEDIKKSCKIYDDDLDKNHINLISYEDYEPFENILKIAIKDGIIKEDRDLFIINKEALLHSYTHHTIRLKNILRVILNEVLIIKKVNTIIKSLVALKEDIVNKKLIELLKIEEIYEYENDYLKYISEDDLKDKKIGRPYLLENGKDICVIALHGFSSAPKEVWQVAKFLHEKGLSVYAPRLRGHGVSSKDLKNRKWEDWYDSISRAIALISLQYKKIYILGFSTGGLLALLSTKKHYCQLKGVICINAALNLNDIRIKTLLPAVSFWNDIVESFNAKKYGKEYVDNNSENPEVNYNKHYVSSIKQLNLLMDTTKKKLKKVDVPTYIIQAKNDPVVNPFSAYEIYEEIRSEKKEVLMLDLDKHIIIRGEKTKELFEKIYDFIKGLA